MPLLKILFVLLAILLALCLLLFAAVCPRAGFRLWGKNGALHIWLKYGKFKFRIYPLPSAAKGKRRREPDRPQAEPTASPFTLEQIDLGDAICLVLDLLRDMKDAMTIEILRADIMLGTGNAARTGILLGQIAALAGMITPFLEQNFSIKNYRIAVDGDFKAETTAWEAEAAFSVRPVRLLWSLIRHRKRLLEIYRLIQKDEASNHE